MPKEFLEHLRLAGSSAADEWARVRDLGPAALALGTADGAMDREDEVLGYVELVV